MSNIIKIKRGLKANLPTLEIGEMGYCTDTNELFIGTATGNELINEDSTINALSDIGDVQFTSLATGDVLTFNGTNWVNEEPAAGGLTLEDLPNQASISDETNTGSVTNTQTRQVNASSSSTASGDRTQVNASLSSIASGTLSQVNVGLSSQATGQNSQVNASSSSLASGAFSQVNASDRCTTAVDRSQVHASRRVLNNELNSLAGGNATSGSASTANRKWHIFSATGNIQIAGTLTSSASFSDFAELFPNATGKKQGYGLLQTLDGDKVKPAQDGDKVIGVVSGTAGLLLNDTPFHWQGRYLIDEWGMPIYEEIPDPDYELQEGETESPLIKVQKENPNYDIEREQISRKERTDEWTVVGLTGQVYVRLNQDVKVGDYVKAWKDGVGQKSEEDTNIIVMKITQPYDSKKGYAIGFCLIK